MIRLAVTLGIVVAVSSFAMGFSEDFESYGAGDAVAGVHGWIETGYGDWFETNAVASGDPSFLGTRYADLGNNGHSNPTSGDARLAQVFGRTTSGILTVDFDVSFSLVGNLNSCNIFLCDSDRTPSSDVALQGAAIFVGFVGLRVHDGDWQTVDNFSVQNDTWYHAWITVDLDDRTWQLAMAAYAGETLGATTIVSYAGDDTFAFRDPGAALDDIGMIEFADSSAVMADSAGRGLYVDNVNVPEPATLSLLAAAGVLAIRRRIKA